MPDLSTTDRKRLGAWATPQHLVDRIVEAVMTPDAVARWATGGRPVRVLDPACGDGRFLLAARRRADELGADVELTGVDVDPVAVETAVEVVPDARLVRADALDLVASASRTAVGPSCLEPEGLGRFDVVLGNPPFLSQLANATTRGGASRHGGGPYADAALEFLALAAHVVESDGGRLGLVLPQSVLSSRDAAPIRRELEDRASMIWSWWSPEPVFDAQVVTCALAFELGRTAPASPATARTADASWSHVVTDRQGIPALPSTLHAASAGTLGDRARLHVDFRNHYYGLVPAVGDHPTGPPLVTSGAIDPGRCSWGEKPIRFAGRRWTAPRVDVPRLDARLRRWAEDRLVPKVLVANQTAVVEAVCDPTGAWLPSVPVVAILPTDGDAALAWRIAALLTSPVASLWAWHRRAGTGLSARSIRLGPSVLAELPWPSADGAADLRHAVDALRAGDVRSCGHHADAAYGLPPDDARPLRDWWHGHLDRLDRRSLTR